MHKIVDLQVYFLKAEDDGPAYWVSNFIVPRANELLIKIRTAAGVEGLGMATTYGISDPFFRAFQSGLDKFILGADAAAPERLYERMLNLTSQRVAYEKGWGRETLVRVLSAIDIACWDAVGKYANLPLYRIFGGHRDEVPCYITCAYYREGRDDLGELKDEILAIKQMGYSAYKVKIGGLSLRDDLKRMEVIRDTLGSSADLMVDANRAWTLNVAVEAAHELAQLNVRWLEEPVRWLDDFRELELLARRSPIPLSAGESEPTAFRCRDLIESRCIQVLQADATLCGGYTALRKLSALCELNHVDFAPHHDCFIHAPIVAASSAGLILESFASDRDPLQAELFETAPIIANGKLRLNEAPGIGVTIAEPALKKYGVRIR